MNRGKRFYEYITAFGAGLSFNAGVVSIAYGAWLFAIISFAATVFLTWCSFRALETEGKQ